MKLLPLLILAASLSATTLQPHADPFSGPHAPRDQRLAWERNLCGFNTQLAYSAIPSNWTGCGGHQESNPIELDVPAWVWSPVHDAHMTQTPEPGAVWLAAAGLVALMVRRWRKA